MITQPLPKGTPIDLAKLQFTFALEQIEPEIGRMEVKQVSWILGEKKKTDIELAPCEEVLTGKIYEELLMVSMRELKPYFNLLCPIFPEELVI